MFKFLLYLFLFYVIFRFIFGVVFKGFIISRSIKTDHNDPLKHREEGEITVKPKPQNTRKDDRNIGEYVDYEEVK